jgi:5'-nucleotidase
MKKLNVLLVNDDGIHADGLKHLYRGLKGKANLSIVAPISERSGSGLSMTLYKPLKISPTSWDDDVRAWSVTGTPADCIKLALNSLLDTVPDLIVSGINRGSNAGRSVLYSGTIGGVIEGMYRNNIPGIAFSASDYENPGFEKFSPYVYPLIQYYLEHPLPQGSFLNVNFPSANSEVQGCRMARQGRSFWADNPDKRIHPADGNPYYWLGGKWRSYEEDPESDVALLQQGFITAVPIHVDELTDHGHFNDKKAHFNTLFQKKSLSL